MLWRHYAVYGLLLLTTAGLAGSFAGAPPAAAWVAGLVCAGLTNKEIASQLNKTEGSVKVQLSGIFQKLRVNSRAKLIVALR